MDYNEILCQAIDTIVAKRISEISFDKTILCTIVDNSKKDNGEYTVTDGSVTFQAYSDYTHYSQNMRVYVQVPMGDYANTKLIIGRYSTEDDEKPLAYVSPLEKVIQVGADYAADIQTPIGLIANDENQTEVLIANKYLAESTINYDTFCIKADFKCLLQNYNIKSGNYGLKVLLITEENEVVDIDLDCTKDMFGNPYAYTTYYPQSQTYRLNLTSNINSIQAYFYQKNNFTYDDGINIEPKRVPTQDYDNIFINNIEMYFAYDANEFSDNTVQINTADGLEYNGLKDTDLEKTLTLTWYNKDDNNKYLGFTDGIFGTLEDAKNPELNTYHIVWEHSLNNGEWEVVGTNSKEINVHLVPIWSINEYRAKVTFQGNTYTSNILQFRGGTGISETQNRLNLLLNLKNGQYSLDSYPLYGADTALINPSEGYRERELYFTYESAVGGSLEPIILDGATACFYIPNNATMLTKPYEEPSSEEKYQLEGYTVYVRQLSSELAEEDRVFKYRIKNNYNPLFFNNTMILKIIDKYGYEYTAQKSVAFSSYGTSGTDYTIIISDKNGQSYFVPGSPLNLEAKLYNANGEEIETENWKWSLYESGLDFDPTAVESEVNKYIVAQASTDISWLGSNTTIKGLYPVAYSNSANYMYQGPTTIVYNSNGVNPIYYEGDIKLFNKYNNSSIECTWSLEYYSKTGAITTDRGVAVLTDSNPPRFKPSPMYLANSDNYLVLCAKNGSTILWRQPLIILQNQYASALLNNWDGNLIVDNSGNYILSSMMGAGSKNSDNQFSGVLMGEVGKVADKAAETGLFGYHEGAQSFGFNVNGTAFLGKSGHGRIEFNGDDGIIKSAGFDTNQKGTMLDLSNGALIMSGDKGYLKFNENNSGLLDLSISSANIKLIDQDNATLGAYINATAEGFTTTVTKALGAKIQFYGICETAATTSLKSVTLLNSENFPTMSADKYPTGTTINVRFVNGNTSDTMKLSISHVAVDSGGEDVFIADSSKGMPQLATGDSVIFVYDAEINDGNGAWVITDSGATSQFKQTSKEISAKVSNYSVGSACSWELKPENFAIYAGQGTSNEVLRVDADGLHITGNGTFTGDLNVANGAFKITSNGVNFKNNFIVDASGVVTAKGGTFTNITATGTITASSIKAENIKGGTNKNAITFTNITASGGSIAGWDINTWGIEYLYDDYLLAGLYSDFAASERGNFTVGTETRNDWRIIISDVFGVASNGSLYASSGRIGPLEISQQSFGINIEKPAYGNMLGYQEGVLLTYDDTNKGQISAKDCTFYTGNLGRVLIGDQYGRSESYLNYFTSSQLYGYILMHWFIRTDVNDIDTAIYGALTNKGILTFSHNRIDDTVYIKNFTEWTAL